MTIDKMLGSAKVIGISGHSHPDGDCVGSCLGLRNYIKTVRPDVEVNVWIEAFSDSFDIMKGAEEVIHNTDEERVCDLFFVLDCGDAERLGGAVKYYEAAKRTVCVDHHMTNTGFADVNIIEPKASSTSEVLYTLMDSSKVDVDTATCLYLGIAFDTGVFRHTNCSLRTMCVTGELIEKGLDTETLLDRTFFRKTFAQNRALGLVLAGARQEAGGKLVFGVLTAREMESAGVKPTDLDGIVEALRVTEGALAAVFIYESADGSKVSMRANAGVNVAEVATRLGGGGHIKAAGCTMKADPEAIIRRLCEEFAPQLNG